MVQNDFYGIFNIHNCLWYYTDGGRFSQQGIEYAGMDWEGKFFEQYWSDKKLTLFSYELTIAHVDTFKTEGIEAHGVRIVVPKVLDELTLGSDGMYRAPLKKVEVDYTGVIV